MQLLLYFTYNLSKKTILFRLILNYLILLPDMKTIIALVLLFQLAYVSFSQTGKLEGRVYNSKTNENLPFVNLQIAGTTSGVATDFDGKFKLENISPGFIQLKVSFVGYISTLTSDIQIINGKTSYIEIPLTEVKYELDQVTITAQRFVKNEESPVSLRSISISEIENSAGANRDIAKIIQSFPGVAAIPGPSRNDIIVRGGASNESRFYIDDVEIPNINHFATQGASGGSNGILNADFLREVNFYSGAFPASKGNVLSAVFDFKQIDGNKDKLKFRTTLGASDLALTLDGPINDKSTFIFSVRRSYLKFLFKALGLPFLPTYNDYQLKAKYRINPKNEITLVSVGALDVSELDTKIKNPTEYQQYILNYLPRYEQWNYTIGSTYKHYRENGYSLIVLSRNMLNNHQLKYLNNDDTNESNKIIEYTSQESENKINIENNIETTNNIKLNYGVNGVMARYSNNTFQKININNVLDTAVYNSSLDLYRYGLFAQASKGFFDHRLDLSLGIRTDACLYDNTMSNPLNQFSPRFSASYTLTKKISISFNTGRYFQLPPYTTLGFKNNEGDFINKNNNISYIKTDHIIGGFSFQPSQNTKFSLEGFIKLYDDYPFSLKDSICLSNRPADYGVFGNEEVISKSKGKAIGLEFLLQSRIAEKTNLVISYTFARSEFEDKFGNFKPSSWDNRHILIITGNKKFNKNWSIALKWRFAGGLPYTPYDIDRSSYISAWDVVNQPYFDYDNVNSKRFKSFHQLDLRIDKSYYLKKSSIKFYFDVQNAYNFKSEEQNRLTNLDDYGNKLIDPNDPTRYNLRTIQSTGGGTILPTLGIILDF